MSKKCYTMEELVGIRNLIVNYHDRLSNDSYNVVLQDIYGDMLLDVAITKWKERGLPTISATPEGYALGVLDYHESLNLDGYKLNDIREAIVLNKKLSYNDAVTLGRKTMLEICVQEFSDLKNVHENFINWKNGKSFDLLSYDEIQDLEDTEIVNVKPKEKEKDEKVSIPEEKEEIKSKTEEDEILERLEPYPDLKELYLSNDNSAVREFVIDNLTRFERDASSVRRIPKDKLESLKKLGKEFDTKKLKPLSELTEEERKRETEYWDNYYRNKAKLNGQSIPEDWVYNLEKGIHEPPVKKEEKVPKKKGFKKATAESIKNLKPNISFDNPHLASKDDEVIEFADGTIPKKFANNKAASDGFSKPKGKSNIDTLRAEQAKGAEKYEILDKDSKIIPVNDSTDGVNEIKNPLLRGLFSDENIMKAFEMLHNRPLSKSGMLEEGKKILADVGIKNATDEDVEDITATAMANKKERIKGLGMPAFEEYKGSENTDRIPREEILYIDQNGDLATVDEDEYNEFYDEIVNDTGFLRVGNGFVTIITGDHVSFMDAAELVPEFEKVLADTEVAANLTDDFKASLKKFIDFHYKCVSDGYTNDEEE